MPARSSTRSSSIITVALALMAAAAQAAPAIVRRDPEIRPITAITCHPPAGRSTICNSDGVWTEFVPGQCDALIAMLAGSTGEQHIIFGQDDTNAVHDGSCGNDLRNYGGVAGADGQPVTYSVSDALLADFLQTYSATTAPGCFWLGSGANEFVCDVDRADVRLWGGYGTKYDESVLY